VTHEAAAPVTPADLRGAPVGDDTVEAVVRHQLAKALGGKRGMLEGAVPIVGFTLVWLLAHNLTAALSVGVAAAIVLLLLRLVQRSTTQFVGSSLLGLGIAAVIALRSGRAEDVFLPGILYNAAAAALIIASIAVRWPFIGLLIGSVTGDLASWRRDPAVLRLCTKLTWIFVIPNIIRVAVQWPLYLAGNVGALGAAKIALGWPLSVAMLAAMLWVLARGRTPLRETPA
jgi:hypothetical protein